VDGPIGEKWELGNNGSEVKQMGPRGFQGQKKKKKKKKRRKGEKKRKGKYVDKRSSNKRRADKYLAPLAKGGE